MKEFPENDRSGEPAYLVGAQKAAHQNLFLAVYAQCGHIGEAAKEAGIGRRTHYNWLRHDEEYRKRFEEAHEDAVESLESEAWRRAKDGTLKPVFYKGYKCGHIREFSDGLLMFLLKGLRPDKYRERVDTNHSGSVGFGHSGGIEVSMQDLMDELDRRDITNRPRIADANAGSVCGDGQSGQVEVRETPATDRLGRNGHHPGSNGSHPHH